jgi:hypothetical protein
MFEEVQIIAALNRIANALESIYRLQQEQIAKIERSETKTSKRTFRYPREKTREEEQ